MDPSYWQDHVQSLHVAWEQVGPATNIMVLSEPKAQPLSEAIVKKSWSSAWVSYGSLTRICLCLFIAVDFLLPWRPSPPGPEHP